MPTPHRRVSSSPPLGYTSGDRAVDQPIDDDVVHVVAGVPLHVLRAHERVWPREVHRVDESLQILHVFARLVEACVPSDRRLRLPGEVVAVGLEHRL